MTAPVTAKEAPVHKMTISLGSLSSRSGFHAVEVPVSLSTAPDQTIFQGIAPWMRVPMEHRIRAKRRSGLKLKRCE
jgi:hypothetical protein